MKRAPLGTKPKKGPFHIDNFSIVKIKKKSRVIGDKFFPIRRAELDLYSSDSIY